MRTRRCALLLTAAVALGACGGSDWADVDDSTPTAPTTTIDLADGALIRNEGGTLDADGVPATAAATDPSVTTGDDTDSGVDPADPSTPVDTAADPASTVAGGVTDGGDGSSGTSIDGGAAGSTTGGSGTTTDGSIDVPAVDPNEGLIVIGEVSYPFAASTCTVLSDEIEILGEGTSSEGVAFGAELVYYSTDIDDDGIDDRMFEIYVDPVVPDGVDRFTLPEFFALSIEGSASGTDGTVTYEVAGSRISGSGTIEDANGIVFAAGSSGPFAFDARCA